MPALLANLHRLMTDAYDEWADAAADGWESPAHRAQARRQAREQSEDGDERYEQELLQDHDCHE